MLLMALRLKVCDVSIIMPLANGLGAGSRWGGGSDGVQYMLFSMGVNVHLRRLTST